VPNVISWLSANPAVLAIVNLAALAGLLWVCLRAIYRALNFLHGPFRSGLISVCRARRFAMARLILLSSEDAVLFCSTISAIKLRIGINFSATIAAFVCYAIVKEASKIKEDFQINVLLWISLFCVIIYILLVIPYSLFLAWYLNSFIREVCRRRIRQMARGRLNSVSRLISRSRFRRPMFGPL